MEELKTKMEKFREILVESANNAIPKVSEGIARSIVLGEKLSATFKKIAQDAIIRILSGLIEMGIRILANIAIIKIEEMLGRKKVTNQNKLIYEDELNRALQEDGQRTSVYITPQTYFPQGS